MKLVVDANHKEYFEKHQAIEFEGLLGGPQLEALQMCLKISLSSRIDADLNKLDSTPQQKLFMAGRDLWRTDPFLSKIVRQKQLAEIASELIHRRPIRLGYDQFFPCPSMKLLPHQQDTYSQLLMKEATLQEISAMQGVLCGLMLCLESNPSAVSAMETSIFSPKAGNGVFFNAERKISFQEIFERQGCSYLLITYVGIHSVYMLNLQDPQVHNLKSYGYVFGDKLSDKLHPILYR
jgi:hypothetical protein